jgi:hypothetical protein
MTDHRRKLALIELYELIFKHIPNFPAQWRTILFDPDNGTFEIVGTNPFDRNSQHEYRIKVGITSIEHLVTFALFTQINLNEWKGVLGPYSHFRQYIDVDETKLGWGYFKGLKGVLAADIHTQSMQHFIHQDTGVKLLKEIFTHVETVNLILDLLKEVADECAQYAETPGDIKRCRLDTPWELDKQ